MKEPTTMKEYREQRREARERKRADEEQALQTALALIKRTARENERYASNPCFPPDEAKGYAELARRLRIAQRMLTYLHADDVEARALRVEAREKARERRRAEQAEKKRLESEGYRTCDACRRDVKEESIGLRTVRAEGHQYGGRRVAVCSTEGAEMWPECPRCQSRHYEAHNEGYRCVADGCGMTWQVPQPELRGVEKPHYTWTLIQRYLDAQLQGGTK